LVRHANSPCRLCSALLACRSDFNLARPARIAMPAAGYPYCSAREFSFLMPLFDNGWMHRNADLLR